jgi:serine/threonine-protein kinase
MTSSTSTMAAPVGIGDVVAGKYEVTKILGVGGMGVVVAARHLELDKLVALKFMHDEAMKTGQTVERFLREARAAARLTNEHIGRVLDVGRLPDGVPYIVMEYLEGRDLHAVLMEHGAMEVADVCEYVLQACEAMAEAHAQGIIHRDLKPENLFLTTRHDGRPLIKVLDFGISKAQYAAGSTGTYTALGTPTHMAPEQVRSSRTVDARADIWSLGVILYQLLSNTLPFEADTVAETMVKVISDPPSSLADVRPGLPPTLVATVARCLEKERDRRFDNVAELAHELIPFAPERARAAVSLIERVMTAKTPAASSRASADDDVLPDGAATAPGFKRQRADAVVVATPTAAAPTIAPALATTLGSAIGQSLEASLPRRLRRWRGIAVLVAAPAITFFGAMFVLSARSGGAAEHESPADESAIGSGSSAIVGVDRPTPPADRGAPANPDVVPTRGSSSEPPPDARVVTTERISALLRGFTAWSKAHAGASCPAAIDLGGEVDDAWGHVLAITCTDQPSNQILGVISAGPDGAMNTADDIVSWQLGPDVTDLVRGTRWSAAPPTPTRQVAKKPTPNKPPKPAETKPVETKPVETKPAEPRKPAVELDDHGMPTSR